MPMRDSTSICQKLFMPLYELAAMMLEPLMSPRPMLWPAFIAWILFGTIVVTMTIGSFVLLSAKIACISILSGLGAFVVGSIIMGVIMAQVYYSCLWERGDTDTHGDWGVGFVMGAVVGMYFGFFIALATHIMVAVLMYNSEHAHQE